jgi:hypothetical protein
MPFLALQEVATGFTFLADLSPRDSGSVVEEGTELSLDIDRASFHVIDTVPSSTVLLPLPRQILTGFLPLSLECSLVSSRVDPMPSPTLSESHAFRAKLAQPLPRRRGSRDMQKRTQRPSSSPVDATQPAIALIDTRHSLRRTRLLLRSLGIETQGFHERAHELVPTLRHFPVRAHES